MRAMLAYRWNSLACTTLRSAQPLLTSSRTVSSRALKGRATVSGTRQFVFNTPLPLYHTFEKTGLLINPIIHGAPKRKYVKSDKSRVLIEALTRRAVVKNRSNCVMVYQFYDGDEPWYSTNLHKLFKDPESNVSREQVVMMANIGQPTSKEKVFSRLADACAVTGLEMIDMVIVELDETSKDALVEDTIEALDALCKQGQLQSYGFQVSVAPFIFHTPPLQQTGPQMMLPLELETTVMPQCDYANLVVYPISPTTAIPSTYPMLSTHESSGDSEVDRDDMDTTSRGFTRAALNPLTCRFGGAAAFWYESPASRSARGLRVRRKVEAGFL